jgi:hypothetical protein
MQKDSTRLSVIVIMVPDGWHHINAILSAADKCMFYSPLLTSKGEGERE